MSEKYIRTDERGRIEFPARNPENADELLGNIELIREITEGSGGYERIPQTIFRCKVDHPRLSACDNGSCPRPAGIDRCVGEDNFYSFRNTISGLIEVLIH